MFLENSLIKVKDISSLIKALYQFYIYESSCCLLYIFFMKYKPICYSVQLGFILKIQTRFLGWFQTWGEGGLNQDFIFGIFHLIFQNLVYTRIFRILVQTLLGEKFVWVGGGWWVGGYTVNLVLALVQQTRIQASYLDLDQAEQYLNHLK